MQRDMENLCEWSPIRLGDVCTKIGSGATPRGGSAVYLEDGPYALIRSQNVYNEGFHHDGLAFIDENHAVDLENVEVLEGDVLLNITGDSVARSCQVDPSILPARVNQHVAIVRPDPSRLDPRFLRYVMISPEIQAKLLSWASSGGTRNALTKSMIESLEVSAPTDIAEQRAIARILGSLDDKIEANRRMNETLEAIARTLFKSWFVDFDPVWAKAEGRAPAGMDAETAALFPDSFEETELGMVPMGWRVAELRDIVDVIDCLHSKKPGRQPKGKPLLQLNNIQDMGLIDMNDTYWICESDYEFWISRIEAQAGDCVITNVGRVGAVAQIPVGLKAALGRNMTALRCNRSYPFPTFLIQCLLSSAMTEEIQLKIDTGTILEALNVKNIPKLRLVLPPKELLSHFEKICRPMRAKMEQNLSESHMLSDLMDTVLPKLLSGEIPVNGLNDRSRWSL